MSTFSVIGRPWLICGLAALCIASWPHPCPAAGDVTPLVRVLQDPNSSADAKGKACLQLMDIGAAAAPAVPALVQQLRSPDEILRDYAVTTLTKIGPAAADAVPALKKVAASDTSESIRQLAEGAIRAIGDKAPVKPPTGNPEPVPPPPAGGDRPHPAGADTPPVTPPAAPPAEKTVRFVRAAIRDQQVGCDAETLLIPSGWKMEGQVNWVANAFHPARVYGRAYNPAGVEQFMTYPVLSFIDGIDRAVPGAGARFPEGSYYTAGEEVRRACRDAQQYLQDIIIPRLRTDLANAKTVGYHELREVAQEVAASPVLRGANAVVSAGVLRLEYRLDNQDVQEDFYCIFVGNNAGAVFTYVGDIVYSCRAPKGKLDGMNGVFVPIATSRRPTLQWYNAREQVRRQMQRDLQAASDRAMDVSRYVARLQNETEDIIRQAYQNRQSTMDRTNAQYSHALRGTAPYYNPLSQEEVTLPAGYANAWVNNRGEIILSNDVNFDPAVVYREDWKKMPQR